ncbi:HAUS augmin-like complex subunit 8 isoform X3 [Ochotona princeps]|uniref:HAUS augmin-like complex subunit 8 isoform X3 n=1 Tax=Ochotona princeps TaxID=9978 RepID=UPI0027147F22|nr:HAUS augmin-like complex subunit 8 isoform X3 [Ochotona princeps]
MVRPAAAPSRPLSGEGGKMADAGDAGKPAGIPGTSGGAKMKEKRGRGGRVVESRYLQYEKKGARKAPAADTSRCGGKAPDSGRKAGVQQSRGVRDGSGLGQGDLQSTMLEGHSAAPPDLDLSDIHGKSMTVKTPQPSKKPSRKAALSTCAPRRKGPMEKRLAEQEQRAEQELVLLEREKERLQTESAELRRRLLLQQKQRELEAKFNAQMQVLGPLVEVADRFQEQYKALAAALDSTRHELPGRAIHLEQDGRHLLDSLQLELTTTQRLLQDLGVGPEEEKPTRALDLLRELRALATQKDLELQRSFAEVLELSAEASQEAALVNQEVLERVGGLAAPSRWYFGEGTAHGEPPGGLPEATPPAGALAQLTWRPRGTWVPVPQHLALGNHSC